MSGKKNGELLLSSDGTNIGLLFYKEMVMGYVKKYPEDAILILEESLVNTISKLTNATESQRKIKLRNKSTRS
jgi:hypothetical protein